MSPSEVIDYAFATGEYIAQGSITESVILSSQLRFIAPVLGEKLMARLLEGDYESLREEYIAPTLGILARIEANLSAYPPTEVERQRAKLFLSNLTDYLNSNADLYAEYNHEDNVMNRCAIVAGFVL